MMTNMTIMAMTMMTLIMIIIITLTIIMIVMMMASAVARAKALLKGRTYFGGQFRLQDRKVRRAVGSGDDDVFYKIYDVLLL